MEKNIKNILSELYEIDESLKDKEEELIKIIKTMINLRPNIKIDEDFKSELRAQISEKITSEKLKNYEKSTKPNMWQILTYVFGTASVAAFWFFIFNENFINNLPKDSSEVKTANIFEEKSKMLTFENWVKEVTGWFWSLKNLSVDGNAKWWMWWAPEIDAKIAQTESVSSEAFMTREFSVNDSMMSDEPMVWKMIMPVDPDWVPEIYRYTFSGELNLELTASMPVYKKENIKSLWKEMIKNLWNFNFNGVNISNFSDLWVSNISLNQDKPYGYSLNIDFDNWGFSIYKNWAKWPQVDYSENTKQIFLNEDEVIQIAQNFLKEYNIDISSYWEPKVDSNYANILAKYTSARIMPDYVNNNTSVVFPLIVDGKEISEEYGQISWVRIEVDLSEKKVVSLNGLSVNNYLKSNYETETNKENILKVANVWGRFGFYTPETDKVKYVDIGLKNPTLKYINVYEYKNNTQEQYLIPAVVFEIEKAWVENYYADSITVPLVKDFYKYDNSWNIVWNSQE